MRPLTREEGTPLALILEEVRCRSTTGGQCHGGRNLISDKRKTCRSRQICPAASGGPAVPAAARHGPPPAGPPPQPARDRAGRALCAETSPSDAAARETIRQRANPAACTAHAPLVLLLVAIAADLVLAVLIGLGVVKGDWFLPLVFAVVPVVGVAYLAGGGRQDHPRSA